MYLGLTGSLGHMKVPVHKFIIQDTDKMHMAKHKRQKPGIHDAGAPQGPGIRREQTVSS